MQNNTYIYHTGVKGMKWGVRRYQNKDGTLTDEGKKRYADKTPERIGLDSPEYKNHNISAKYTREHQAELTDNQLRAAIGRIDMQVRINSLAPTKYERASTVTKKYRDQFIGAIMGVAIASATAATIKGTKKLWKKTNASEKIANAASDTIKKTVDIYNKLFKR